jgi:hypothetical protein
MGSSREYVVAGAAGVVDGRTAMSGASCGGSKLALPVGDWTCEAALPCADCIGNGGCPTDGPYVP